MIDSSIKILNDLRYENGLFAASSKTGDTGYDKAWLRDNVYASLGLEKTDIRAVVRTFRCILDILLKHEYKIDWMIKDPDPKLRFRYIHARFHPEKLTELHDEWGNKQNDSIGAILWKIGELESKKIKVIRNMDDLRIIEKLVTYLAVIEYWHDADNGMWEESEEIHASSVGACVAGLKKISKIVYVDKLLIAKGEETLNKLLPRESKSKEVDLALLSLIWPYHVVSEEQKLKILTNVEEKLVRSRGVARYLGDQYYNKNGEAEWTMGFPWLALIYKNMNNPAKYAEYLLKTIDVTNKKGELPELYYANSPEHNENSPLGWAQSLFILAGEDVI